MYSSITLNQGIDGPRVLTDETGGKHVQCVKLILGSEGVNEGPAGSGNMVPVYSPPFKPIYGAGQPATATAVADSLTVDANAKQLSLSNMGLNICYIRVSTSALNAATTADYPLLPGGKEIITKDAGENIISFIAPDGDTTIHIIPGSGN
jgi:hypothetical protein